jgi:hypothetical protein
VQQKDFYNVELNKIKVDITLEIYGGLWKQVQGWWICDVLMGIFMKRYVRSCYPNYLPHIYYESFSPNMVHSPTQVSWNKSIFQEAIHGPLTSPCLGLIFTKWLETSFSQIP